MLCWVAQSCLTLCDLMDCSPAGSSVHGILQARILEWVAMPSTRGSSQPRNWTQVSHIAGSPGGLRNICTILKICNLYRFDLSLIMNTYFHNIIMLVFHHVIISFQTNQTDPSWFLFFNFTFSEGGSQHCLNFYKQLVIGSSMTIIKSDEQKQGDLGSSKDSVT